MSFLPEDYNAPKSASKFYKFEQGDNLFRILDDVVLGWEDWEDKVPVRIPYAQPKPEPISTERPVKHFWAFPIWDYRDKMVKVLEITQASIQESIANLYNDKDWGEPTNYDINVIRTGEGFNDTKYNVVAKPPKPLSAEIKKVWEETDIDLKKLFTGGDPFSPNSDDISVVDDDEIPDEEIPF